MWSHMQTNCSHLSVRATSTDMDTTYVQDCQQMSNGTLGIPKCSVLELASAKCPILHYRPSHPTVHPMPLYHGKEWTDWNHTIVFHLLHPVLTVHPIPLYHGREWTDYTTNWEHIFGVLVIIIVILYYWDIKHRCTFWKLAARIIVECLYIFMDANECM